MKRGSLNKTKTFKVNVMSLLQNFLFYECARDIFIRCFQCRDLRAINVMQIWNIISLSLSLLCFLLAGISALSFPMLRMFNILLWIYIITWMTMSKHNVKLYHVQNQPSSWWCAAWETECLNDCIVTILLGIRQLHMHGLVEFSSVKAQNI